jgi:hypothetical protein
MPSTGKPEEVPVKERHEKTKVSKVENFGFALMAAVPYAHLIVQWLAHKHPKGIHHYPCAKPSRHSGYLSATVE